MRGTIGPLSDDSRLQMAFSPKASKNHKALTSGLEARRNLPDSRRDALKEEFTQRLENALLAHDTSALTRPPLWKNAGNM